MRFSAASAQALLAARVDTHYVSLSPRQETHFRSKATCFDHSILKTAAEHILLSSVRAEISRAHLGSPFLFPKACTPVPLQLAGSYLCLSSHPFPKGIWKGMEREGMERVFHLTPVVLCSKEKIICPVICKRPVVCPVPVTLPERGSLVGVGTTSSQGGLTAGWG